jgi:hypothetical protein
MRWARSEERNEMLGRDRGVRVEGRGMRREGQLLSSTLGEAVLKMAGDASTLQSRREEVSK